MKSFVLSMVLGVGLVTAAVVVGIQTYFPQILEEQPTATRPSSRWGSFRRQDAVETVAARLGEGPKAEAARHTLRTGARVTFHSYNHWTVSVNDASWTAHGPTSTDTAYAEPDNLEARIFERDAGGP